MQQPFEKPVEINSSSGHAAEEDEDRNSKQFLSNHESEQGSEGDSAAPDQEYKESRSVSSQHSIIKRRSEVDKKKQQHLLE